MKWLSKIMVSLACVIILVHAVVPHHHDDCCGGAECFFCTEHHHDHCCHHDGDHQRPFDSCKLQEMLSHLVLTTRDDEAQLADLMAAEAHDYFVLALSVCPEPLPAAASSAVGICRTEPPAAILCAPAMGAAALRAPPAV